MNDERQPHSHSAGPANGDTGARPKKRISAPRKSQEIFDATLGLLQEGGYEGLTVEGVAERAGVNKTTLYRWWPSKGALLGAALVNGTQLDFPLPDTGSLQGDLEAVLGSVVTLLTTEPASKTAIAALGAITQSPELATHARRFFADRLDREQPILSRAVARGELASGTDPALLTHLMDLLAGAAWLRLVFRQLPLDADFVTRTVDTVLHGAVARP
ncbi:TetR/AcrR family transcriptional regulator [Streptomyces sp. NBC_00237]|uniref:TetR/AcrR family transcriptional regulator n=1 Tax=Streptomyces sp. NBC_00237 TaxID=2975687 RepID=UPI0022580CAE|nr:TetR/AcrR family transcriptional regulator [Streptomyces sp. NBC_00237]MCX5206510.1 TetR/AcrR family transcriptional regulator [Streptomyces sp. NBC_00237]